MGGDKAPYIVVEGAHLAREKFPEAKFIIYGDEAQIRPLVKKYNGLESVVEVLSTSRREGAGDAGLLRERATRKYLGDYTLFMSGIFRAHVEKRGFLDYYLREGSRSYWTVSEMDLSLYRTGFILFQELSKKFEYYSGALDYMRKAYFAPAPGEDPFAGFVRQIEGWMNVNLTEN